MKTHHLYHTPEGFDDIILETDDDVLTGLWFVGSRPIETHGRASLRLPIIRWLDIYFSGHQPDFTPIYRLDNLTPFRKMVLDMVCEIPFGQTRTYGDIAQCIASPHTKKMSAQAVGGAVGWNPICLIVPCHRVMGANGKLTGYGGGIHNKIALLKLEGHETFTI